MTIDQARKVIAEHPNAINLVKESHLHALSDLVEVHVEVVRVRRDECTKKWEKGGSIFSPSDVAINRIGTAAGIEFEPKYESTRKTGPYVWVGSSQGRQRAPDGTFEYGAPCEYEWDAELRREENEVKGKTDWDNKDAEGNPGTKPYTERELLVLFIDYRKFGCQRANTGARARAIVYLLGMKRGLKGLFADKGEATDTREFLVSRIIVNAKNTLVMKAMIANLGHNANALYGPTQITGPAQAAESFDPAEGARRVGPEAEGKPPVNDDWGDPSPGPSSPTVDPELEMIMGALIEWTVIGGPVGKRAQKIIDRGETDLRILRPSLEIIKYLGTNNPRGQKSCAEALDMLVQDPSMLEETVKKIRGVAAPAQAAAS